MTQMSRISKYVESLMTDSVLGEEKSVILTAQASLIASGDNTKCYNYEEVSCGDTNDECTNYGVCQHASNELTCLNKPNFNYDTDKCKA